VAGLLAGMIVMGAGAASAAPAAPAARGAGRRVMLECVYPDASIPDNIQALP